MRRRRALLALCRNRGDAEGVGIFLNWLGERARLQGDYTRASELYEEAITLSAQAGRRSAAVLTNLGQVILRRTGQAGRAVTLFTEALTAARDESNPLNLGYALAGFAGAAVVRGDLRRAVRLLSAVDRIFTAMDAPMVATDRADFDYYLTRVRAELDGAAFAAGWAAGQQLSPEQAVAEALAVAADVERRQNEAGG